MAIAIEPTMRHFVVKTETDRPSRNESPEIRFSSFHTFSPSNLFSQTWRGCSRIVHVEEYATGQEADAMQRFLARQEALGLG